MNEQLEALFNAIGGLSEMCRLFYNNLMKQGFTSRQALELTKSLVASAFTAGGNSHEQD